jgi:hypothetical protein
MFFTVTPQPAVDHSTSAAQHDFETLPGPSAVQGPDQMGTNHWYTPNKILLLNQFKTP